MDVPVGEMSCVAGREMKTLLSARRLFTVNDVCALVQLQPSGVIRHSPGRHTIQSVSWSDESVRLDIFDRVVTYFKMLCK